MAKKNNPPMMMKSEDVKSRRKLLENWDYICIICGHEFANIACVTKEHIIPKCMVPRGMTGNIAPSHHQCNKLRSDSSIIETSHRIDARKRTMSHETFIKWLNAPVPNRTVPIEALVSIKPLRCLELPEYLPGM